MSIPCHCQKRFHTTNLFLIFFPVVNAFKNCGNSSGKLLALIVVFLHNLNGIRYFAYYTKTKEDHPQFSITRLHKQKLLLVC